MKLRALVVEDCPVMRKLLLRSLTVTGLAEFRFTEAEDGVNAWERFCHENPDIIFADWNMPKLTGIDFVRKVRSSPKGAGIPIVMVTGNGTTGNIEDALDGAGADIYITKPYTVDGLRTKLAKLIEGMEAAQSERAEPRRTGLFSRIIGGVR